jgi:hypothetical protein
MMTTRSIGLFGFNVLYPVLAERLIGDNACVRFTMAGTRKTPAYRRRPSRTRTSNPRFWSATGLHKSLPTPSRRLPPQFDAARRLGLATSVDTRSQRLQEVDDGFLLAARQLPEALGHPARFATMSDDGVAQRQRCLVVHQPRAQPDTP